MTKLFYLKHKLQHNSRNDCCVTVDSFSDVSKNVLEEHENFTTWTKHNSIYFHFTPAMFHK